MLRRKYRPNYEALYPSVLIGTEVLSVLKKSDRKMEYQEYDLKVERPKKDADGIIIALLPAREDSLERLIEVDVQFPTDDYPLEEIIEAREEVTELYRCLDLLNTDERALIEALYFEGMSEQKYASKIGLAQSSVHARKCRILAKIKNIFIF